MDTLNFAHRGAFPWTISYGTSHEFSSSDRLWKSSRCEFLWQIFTYRLGLSLSIVGVQVALSICWSECMMRRLIETAPYPSVLDLQSLHIFVFNFIVAFISMLWHLHTLKILYRSQSGSWCSFKFSTVI